MPYRYLALPAVNSGRHRTAQVTQPEPTSRKSLIFRSKRTGGHAPQLGRIGEPTALGQASRVEWIALDSVPRMINEGEIWSASSLVALARVLLKWR